MTIAVMHLNARAATQDQRVTAMMGYNKEDHATAVADMVAVGGLYEIVAVLPGVTDLDYAWQHTNNIDQDWASPERAARYGVIANAASVRSTSVGDVMVLVVDGKINVHVVSAFGFTDVTQRWKDEMARLGRPVREAV